MSGLRLDTDPLTGDDLVAFGAAVVGASAPGAA
jgi:hypothetical protein